MVPEPLAGSSSAGIDLHGIEGEEDSMGKEDSKGEGKSKREGEGKGKGEGKGGEDSGFSS